MANRKMEKLVYCDGIARHSETKTAADNSVRREIDELGKQMKVMDREKRKNLRRLSVTRKDLERSMTRYSQRMAEINAQRGLLRVSDESDKIEEQRAKCRSLTALDKVGTTGSRKKATPNSPSPQKRQLTGSIGDLRTLRKDKNMLPPPDIKITKSDEDVAQERHYESSDSESSVEIIQLFESMGVKDGQQTFITEVQSCPSSPVLGRRSRKNATSTGLFNGRSRSAERNKSPHGRGRAESPNTLSPQSLSPILVRKRFRYSEAVESALEKSETESVSSFVSSGAVTVSGPIEYDPPAVEVEPLRPLLGRHSPQPSRAQKLKSPTRKHSADLKTLLTKRAFSRLGGQSRGTINEA